MWYTAHIIERYACENHWHICCTHTHTIDNIFFSFFVLGFLFLVLSCNITWNENLLDWLKNAKAEGKFQMLGKFTILPLGTNGTGGESAQYVTFGRWPKTIKARGVTVDESVSKEVGMFTYFLGSDGEWYCKALENAKDNTKQYSNGEQVKAATENSYQYFKVEPIKWRVLKEDYVNDGTNHRLIFPEQVLMANVSFNGNTYEKSKIRAWCNGLQYSSTVDYTDKGFLQTAFTERERQEIAVTTITEGTGDATVTLTDKVFLLSQNESIDLFSDNDARIRLPTDFALANYCIWDSTGSWLFLRTFSNAGGNVHSIGGIGQTNMNVTKGNLAGGVAPALCIVP